MGDGKKSKSPEEVRAFVDSDAFAEGFKKWCVTSFKKWWHENPEEAAAIDRTLSRVAEASRPIFEPLVRVGEAFRRIFEPLAPVAEASGPIFEPLALVAEVLLADGHANEHKRRFQAEGVAVPFDEAVRLAVCLMALRLPYRPAQKGEERPADTLPYIYDYEMLAMESLRNDDRLQALIDESESSPLAWRALQAALRFLRESQKPIGDALTDWSFDVASGKREYPKVTAGRSPYTHKVRNDLIVKTVRDLVACGLPARHNDGAAPKSACDAVSQALKVHGVHMEYSGVETVWRRRQHGANQPII